MSEYIKRLLEQEDLYELPHLLIQTGCRYTVHGQRLLALKLDDDILCKDYDRGIDYFFEDCPLEAKAIEKREKAMGNKDSFFHPGIILWQVWDHWAKVLDIDLRSRETIEREKKLSKFPNSHFRMDDEESGDLDTFLEKNERSQDAQDFNLNSDPYDYVE